MMNISFVQRAIIFVRNFQIYGNYGLFYTREASDLPAVSYDQEQQMICQQLRMAKNSK